MGGTEVCVHFCGTGQADLLDRGVRTLCGQPAMEFEKTLRVSQVNCPACRAKLAYQVPNRPSREAMARPKASPKALPRALPRSRPQARPKALPAANYDELPAWPGP